MAKQIIITQSDFDLIQEAVLYMSKRFFAPADSIALNEIEERLDELRRRGIPTEGAALVLEPSQNAVLNRVLLAYADELNHPASDASNRARIARLRSLATPPKPIGRIAGGLWGRIRNWLTGS